MRPHHRGGKEREEIVKGYRGVRMHKRCLQVLNKSIKIKNLSFLTLWYNLLCQFHFGTRLEPSWASTSLHVYRLQFFSNSSLFTIQMSLISQLANNIFKLLSEQIMNLEENKIVLNGFFCSLLLCTIKCFDVLSLR